MLSYLVLSHHDLRDKNYPLFSNEETVTPRWRSKAPGSAWRTQDYQARPHRPRALPSKTKVQRGKVFAWSHTAGQGQTLVPQAVLLHHPSLFSRKKRIPGLHPGVWPVQVPSRS